MRVISGKLKGRRISRVPSDKTRPTSDKIKEAVFHVMGPYFDGGHALDLFAGSGASGIEALSRGVESVTFIDRSPEAVKTIKKNVQALGIAERSSIYRNDALRALSILARKNKKFDLVFIDPPYGAIDYSAFLEQIQHLHIVNPGCFIYIEYPPQAEITYDAEFFEPYFQRVYGKTTATLILKVNEA